MDGADFHLSANLEIHIFLRVVGRPSWKPVPVRISRSCELRPITAHDLHKFPVLIVRFTPAALAKDASDEIQFEAMVGPVTSAFSLRGIREVIEERFLSQRGHRARKVI